ncbi:MAG: FAD-dependent oxidoreductase [Acidimicrobiales bacterium]|nr:FAD-dependent oxidoreductase [Acidimicrobiales bacterium]
MSASSPDGGDTVDAVVVGAGLAGLCAARHLTRAGRSVVVLEAGDGVGGRVRSDRVDGFVLDRGFQVLLTAYPAAQAELDYARLRLHAFEPGAEIRTANGFHVVGDPLRRPRTLVSTALAPIGTPADKLRLLALRRRVRRSHAAALLRGPDDTTIDRLRSAGFSPRMIDRFFRPLFGGIQLDPALGGSARMFDIVFRMLSEGESAVPADGMGAIPAQLAADLVPGSVRLGCPVVSIDGTSVTVASGERVDGRAVVVATDGPAASQLLGLPTVGSKRVACVYFAADAAPTPHRYVVLDGTGAGPALNVAVMSNVAPSYAPSGSHLVAAAVTGSTPALDLDDASLAAAVRRQLRGWWGAEVDGWRHLRTDRIAHGQPDQTPPFHPKQRVSLGDGRFVCGDHRDTASIQGALFSGRRCAEAVAVATSPAVG